MSWISCARSRMRIRHRLLHRHAGDLPHDVHLALDVLDVERGDDVDARVEQFQHVLIAFRVAGAGRVGVGEFIHQQEIRPSLERGVEIELLQHVPAVFELLARQNRQPVQQRRRFLASVGFHHADEHLQAVLLPLPGRCSIA